MSSRSSDIAESQAPPAADAGLSTGESSGNAAEAATVAASPEDLRAAISRPAAPGRRYRRRRPPAWAIRLVSWVRGTQFFLKHDLASVLYRRRHEMISYAVSVLMLLSAALLMASVMLPDYAMERLVDALITVADSEEMNVRKEQLQVVEPPEQLVAGEIDSNLKQVISSLDDGPTQDEMLSVEKRDPTMDLVPTDREMMEFAKQGELGGRSEAGRQASLKKYGGTEQSERAVSSGLKWLQKQQQKNGSWSFQKVGENAAAGRLRGTEVGATSLALLCYLGAGHTHRSDSPYRDNVRRGLAFIGSQAEDVQGTADLRAGAPGNSGMYVQGLATICLAEAFALERRDDELERLTQAAVAFIERSQDPIGGGWRYRPREEGDTSVVGWQVMALQSARAGRLKVSYRTLREVREFLRSVRGDPLGSTYKYRPDDERAKDSMTAVGLLCRLYLGWRPDFEPMQQGVARLATVGPSRTNLYYNYYATQVLHHVGGPQWREWNPKMRQQLVQTQIKEGPAAGSWAPTDSHGRTGGQLYQTALSILTLEVYYRHLPMYQRLQRDPSITVD